MMTKRHGRSTTRENGMEVETIPLALLFGGEKPPRSRLPPEEVDAESWLMEALAELEEDERLDDGDVEIPSDEEFIGNFWPSR